MGHFNMRYIKLGTSSHELNIDAIPDGAQRHALTQGEQTIVGIKVFESLPVAMGEPTTGSQLTPKSWVAAVTVQRTTKTMTLYVNSGATYISTKGEMIGAGNDTTGTGTLDTPYASIQKAINMLPKYLEHDVTIIVCGMPHRDMCGHQTELMASVSLLEARVQQFVWKHPREKTQLYLYRANQ